MNLAMVTTQHIQEIKMNDEILTSKFNRFVEIYKNLKILKIRQHIDKYEHISDF